MNVKKLIVPALLVVIIVGLIFASRFLNGCSSDPVDYHEAVIDSLTRNLNKAITLQKYYNSQAELAYQRGMDVQKSKVIIRRIFSKDTAANHRFKKHVKDSMIKAMFTDDPTMDTSLFTEPVANGVLDLKSENKMLKSDDLSDSTTIASLKEAYHAKDSACNACGDALEAKGKLLGVSKENESTAKKEAKKQGLWKKVAIGVAVVFAIMAGAK